MLQKLLSFFSASPSAVGVDFLFCLKARRELSPAWQMAWFCYLLSVWHLASLAGCFLTEFYFPNATWYRFISSCPLDSAVFLNGKGFDCICLVVNMAAHSCPVLHFLGPWAQTIHESCTLWRMEWAHCFQHPFLKKKIRSRILGKWQNLL